MEKAACSAAFSVSCEPICKPGSVLTVIYLGVPLPAHSSHPGDGRASQCPHTGVAPDRVYSIGHSRADGCALTAPFHPYLRYLHTSGGLFLLHFSSDRSGRALPVILALWSPDFPHRQAFALPPRLSDPLAVSILPNLAAKVNENSLPSRQTASAAAGVAFLPCPML